MKAVILFCFAISVLLFSKVSAQTDSTSSFTVVEQMPEFPGGQAAMNKFIMENIVYPAIGREKNIQGKVVLKFLVDTDGSIIDFEVLRGITDYPEFEEEVIRVVKKMPLWKPGKQDGKAVSMWFTMPMSFSLGR